MDYKQKVGQFGEELAKNYLIRHGYAILESNVKISYQEIDIIASQQEEIVFFEVKTRTSLAFGPADEAIGYNKIKNLKKAIRIYLGGKKIDPDKIRLDLISIDINKSKKIANIKHYKNIF